ncbi:polysaccharide biosynthesis tyrosine autokinase [Ktedonospora formicarum]|uniref:Polysaccharide chain length determinant N-terminal domain-containing protein n=1 Tax=Ktedonospora formicarum TaxID=2778364 RepID=A0A8J3HYY5_9CHLR|nr:polysaccharide biosynthesis tyrosine autokinase [Ktedonospora formicarum]GHO46319.1 hypothetical protein KSX_44820 [Ktedonospora formicarum]
MQMYIRHFLWVLRRYLLLIIVGVVVCTVLTGMVSVVKTPKYEAVAMVQVSMANGDNTNDVFSNQAQAVNFALKMTTTDVLKAATQKVPTVSVEDLRESITAAPVDGTQLIGVHATTSNAQLSADEANAVANAFIEYEKTKETQRLQAILDKLRSQIVTAQHEGDQTGMTSLQDTYSNVQTQLTLLDGGLFLQDQALPPTAPNGTSLVVNAALGFALSLIVMCVLAILLDWVDVSVKTPEDVTQLARLEALGSVPLRKGSSLLTPSTIASDEELDEAFTVVSASFQALYNGQRSLIVTGMRSRDGVTVIASQLATSLAQSGLRVLLIDANLRRPKLHQIFQANNSRGLSTVLPDVYALKKQRSQLPAWLGQWKTPTPNLWLLPAGVASVPPLTVLRSMELRKLVEWLVQDTNDQGGASAVDLVIFDAPGLDEQADVSTLAALCDSSLLVVEAGKVRKEGLKTAQALLQRLSAPLMGVVINRQKETHYPYFYTGQEQQVEAPVEVTPASKYALLRPAEEVVTPQAVSISAPMHSSPRTVSQASSTPSSQNMPPASVSPAPRPVASVPSTPSSHGIPPVPATPDLPTAQLPVSEINTPSPAVVRTSTPIPEMRKSGSSPSYEPVEERASQVERPAQRAAASRPGGWKTPSFKKVMEENNPRPGSEPPHQQSRN